ncbi:MAG TPA: hypothetical protein VJ867_16835 [Gemmatimonadaceae bacterium]|nr:hypothetical protein [Gemmatimonadaceae bacterium]
MTHQRQHQDYNANSELTDDALVEREASEHREYLRLENREQQHRDTTYQALTASPALIRAWERWWATKVARRLRGLISSASRVRDAR